MSTLLFVLTAVFHLVIPLGAAVLLAVRPARSKVSRGLGLVALLGYSGFLLIAGAGWGMLGQPGWLIVATVVPTLALVAAFRARRAPTRPAGARGWLATAAAGLLALLTLSPYPSLAGTLSQLDSAVDLASPLEQGDYLVIHGGNDAVVNHHALAGAQRHALDFVAVDTWGFRASSPMPEALSDYRIFGRRVLAPCDGTIVDVREDLADLPPPTSDRNHPAGNHVLLHCPGAGITLVLAHLQQESVGVEVGQTVATGEALGQVGNTGNTSEPHLHIHAVAGKVEAVEEAIRTATPVAVTFEGRALLRNDTFTSRSVVD